MTTAISTKVSAPGKVILHGEHSVVYGKLAIAASLDLRTTVTLQEKNNGKLEIQFTDLKFRYKFEIDKIKQIFQQQTIPTLNSDEKFSFDHPDNLNHPEFIEIITKSLNITKDTFETPIYLSIISLLYLYFGIVHSSNTDIVPMLISVKTNLSLGSGTGSSASLMVSLSGAFLHYVQLKSPGYKPSTDEKKFTETQLNLISKWSFLGEKIIHGNPSGIDNTVCTYGSMVSFRKGRSPFPVKTSGNIVGVLVDTKVPKNTGEMVKKVAMLKQRRPKIVEALLDAMDELTDDALEVLVRLGEVKEENEKDVEACYLDLKELSHLNHDLLRTLGASHPSLDSAVKVLRSFNLPSKMTGAGGGGFAIALRPPGAPDTDIATACEQLEKMGFVATVTKLGGDGVRVE